MNEQLFASWQEQATEAANQLYAKLATTDNDVKLPESVQVADANGTNSPDEAFLDLLAAGGHINDDFLTY